MSRKFLGAYRFRLAVLSLVLLVVISVWKEYYILLPFALLGVLAYHKMHVEIKEREEE